MRIAVIGTGYVGLVTGTCFAETGHDVTCVDVDARKIEALNAGRIPIYEPGLEELVRRNAKERRLSFTTSYDDAIPGAEIAFIAVGTPPGETGEADLSHVLGAAEQVARAMTGYLALVNKSTVPVGSAEKVSELVLKTTRHPFDVVSNPEFLKEGTAIDDFMRPDRIVVGVASDRARALMQELYAPFVRTEQPILFMDLRSAELTKYAANAMLATRISFMNEMATLCERLGANVDQVRRGIGSDRRIGHPFLFPGVGFGGSCLAGDETVLVRSEGRTRLVALADLFDALATSVDGIGDSAAIHPHGLEVLAWRAQATAPEMLPVAAVTRRPLEGEAVLVRTKMGRRLLCTPDHPFLAASKDGKRFELRPAAALSPADWLPLATGSTAAAPAASTVLNVLAGLPAAGLEPANVLVEPALEVRERLSAGGARALHAALSPLGHPRGVDRARDILRAGTLRLDELRVAGATSEGGRLATAKNGTRVPVEIEATEAFWRVVGLYLAEGHVSADGARRRLFWSFHPTREAGLAREVAEYWRSLGVRADVRRGTTTLNVSVSSRILAALWLDVLEVGADCYTHRIPDLTWEAPLVHRKALLAGLWRGDGSWSLVNGGPSVVLEWGTVSRALADGVLRLLGDLGFVARLKVGRTSKSTVDTCWVIVSGADQVVQLLDFVPEADHVGIRASLRRQAKRIAPTGYVTRNGASRVRVESVEPRRFRGHVYSLEVPGAHTFVTTGGLVTHNCFPKDVRAVMTMARQIGLDFDLLRSVERVNERQKRWLVERATKHFGSLAGRTFGVWGLAFKPKTDDMREAPAITVIEGLLGNGARVKAHDPVAAEVATKLFAGRGVELAPEPYAAAQGVDALLLVTEWNEFRNPDWARLKAAMREPVLFDGRNVWDPAKARAAGFTYYGVGRGAHSAGAGEAS